MKKIVMIAAIFCLGLTASSCNSCASQKAKTAETPETRSSAPAVTAEVTVIEGYFLKNTYNFDQDTAFFVFGDQGSFDNYVGVGRTMSNNPTVPSFTENVVALIAARPADTQSAIEIAGVETQGDKAVVDFKVVPGEKIGYTMTPQTLFSFPKAAGLKTVEFTTGGKTVTTVALDKAV